MLFSERPPIYASSCMTIWVNWLYEWFSRFHRCGTYSVLSRSLHLVFMLSKLKALGGCSSHRLQEAGTYCVGPITGHKKLLWTWCSRSNCTMPLCLDALLNFIVFQLIGGFISNWQNELTEQCMMIVCLQHLVTLLHRHIPTRSTHWSSAVLVPWLCLSVARSVLSKFLHQESGTPCHYIQAPLKDTLLTISTLLPSATPYP